MMDTLVKKEAINVKVNPKSLTLFELSSTSTSFIYFVLRVFVFQLFCHYAFILLWIVAPRYSTTDVFTAVIK